MSVNQLSSQMNSASGTLVVTGAGVSVASGIAPFRGSDPDAVWNQDVLEKGTFAYFREDVLGSWSWYLGRFASLFDKDPNAGHQALVDIEKWLRSQKHAFTLVTQNIDGLHKAAGSRNVFEIHGTAQRLRCARTGCRYGEPHGSVPFPRAHMDHFKAHPSIDNIPRCVQCGDFLRPHVLWFDEYYTAHSDYRYADLFQRIQGVEVVLFVGTSFSVGITASLIEHAIINQIPMWSIDPCEPDIANIQWIQGASEIVLPELYACLAGG